MLRSLRRALALLTVFALPLAAQEDVSDLFDQDPLYEQAGVLRAKGEIPFFADVSFLRGRADSTQAVLGVGLSNSTFQFVKEDDAYRAAYELELRLRGDPGSFQNEWRETVRAASFDETLLDRETVVFQSSFGLLPGEYDLELEVRDVQSGESSKVESRLKVPAVAAASAYAVSEPVLLRSFEPAAETGASTHVLYPSHYYAFAPQRISFFVEVYGEAPAGGAAPRLQMALVPDGGGPAVSTATLEVPPLQEGVARVYGTLPGHGMQAGLYRLTVALVDASGATLDEGATKLSLSAVTQWVNDNWEEAVELVAYEATDDEREALEDTPAGRRIAAWNAFWNVRDPVPATPGNEAFETYFRRIVAANASFGTKLRPGWKSDRGRVYVAFGAPNDVIRRPIQSGGFPVEIWVYDVQGFEIAFEDRIGFGNYQMVNPGTFANELAALERRKHRAIAERRAQQDDLERSQPAEGGEGEAPGGRTPPDSSGTGTDASASRPPG